MAEVAIKQNESDTLQAPFLVGMAQAGNPLPIGGAHQYCDGVNFVLFSRHATRVDGGWLRGVDLNHRPLGYEPNELPDCSTPHKNHITAR
jgi:hypothetical protein